MLPTATLTSMFDEPSSGSNSSRYSPARVLRRQRVDRAPSLRSPCRRRCRPIRWRAGRVGCSGCRAASALRPARCCPRPRCPACRPMRQTRPCGRWPCRRARCRWSRHSSRRSRRGDGGVPGQELVSVDFPPVGVSRSPSCCLICDGAAARPITRHAGRTRSAAWKSAVRCSDVRRHQGPQARRHGRGKARPRILDRDGLVGAQLQGVEHGEVDVGRGLFSRPPGRRRRSARTGRCPGWRSAPLAGFVVYLRTTIRAERGDEEVCSISAALTKLLNAGCNLKVVRIEPLCHRRGNNDRYRGSKTHQKET